MSMLATAVLLSVLQTEDWQDNLESALSAARKAGKPLLILFDGGAKASRETLKAFDDPVVRQRSAGFVKAKLPADGRIAKLLKIKWSPTVMLFQPRAPGDTVVTPKDQAIMEKLKSIRITIDMQDAPLTAIVDYIREISGLNIHIDTQAIEAPDDVIISIKIRDATVESALSMMFRPRKLDYRVVDGAVMIESTDFTGSLDWKRTLRRIKLGELAGSPTATESDPKTVAVLQKKVTANFSFDTWDKAVKILNGQLGGDFIQLDPELSGRETGVYLFKDWTAERVLRYVAKEHGFVWYHKAGKVVLGRSRKGVSLSPKHISDFFYSHVELDESTLPKETIGEVETLIRRLGSDSNDARDEASARLLDWARKAPTTKRVMRRVMGRTGDAEIRARLKTILASGSGGR